MHLSTYLLAILASLTAAAPHATQPCKAESWPSNSPGGPVPSSPSGLWEGTSTRCYTKMGTTSGLWNTATSWTTRYIPCTITSTSTATTTLTLAPTTATITVTSTGTTVGSTSFSTVIQGTTSTSTVDTTTTTVTTTTTTTTSTVFSTSTTTVAAPATFTPIQTSLPGSTYSGSGGSDPISKREVKARHHREQSSGLGLCQWHYPQGVTCHHWVPEKCSTTITTTTLTVTAWGQTVTTTSVSIVTTTSIPPGTVTATSTATTSTVSTITDTSTSTLTSTTTTYLSTTTLYAACASNNLADEYNGSGLISGEGGYTSVADTTGDDAYDCCVAAVTLGDTSIWGFDPNAGSGDNNCFIGQTDDTCPDPATNPSTVIIIPGRGIVFGNSYCGAVDAAIPEITGSSSS